MFSLSVAGLVACDPLVPLGESSGDSESSTSSVGSSGFSEPSNPSGSVPPNPSTTSPIGCAPGTYVECTCPGGGYGEQVCSSQGEFGACECYGDDITWGTSSGGWWGSSGSSGWWGSSSSGSSGGWDNPEIPELPPGETCLPFDMPCVGGFDVSTDEELEAIGICSNIEGFVHIHDGVTTLAPLGCLRQVDEFLGIIATPLTNLSGLAALEVSGGVGLADNPQLATVDIPLLQVSEEFYVFDNPSLVSLDLPSLTEVTFAEVFNNILLPECEIEALFMQSSPTKFSCDGNLADICGGLCG